MKIKARFSVSPAVTVVKYVTSASRNAIFRMMIFCIYPLPEPAINTTQMNISTRKPRKPRSEARLLRLRLTSITTFLHMFAEQQKKSCKYEGNYKDYSNDEAKHIAALHNLLQR